MGVSGTGVMFLIACKCLRSLVIGLGGVAFAIVVFLRNFLLRSVVLLEPSFLTMYWS